MEKIVEIRPERVRFVGPAGKPLSVEVEIMPRKDFPFTIQQIQAQKGKFIKYEMIRRCTRGADRCVIRVESIREDKGRYFDVIFLLTDSAIRPKIPIYVVGNIQ